VVYNGVAGVTAKLSR